MDVSDSSGTSPVGVERKLVAVLVCEIDEPTPLSGAQHDPDQGVQRSAGNLTRMQAEVSRHGGMVAEVMGDTLVAVFGLPRTHDDDAERAVRTAWRSGLRLPVLALMTVAGCAPALPLARRWSGVASLEPAGGGGLLARWCRLRWR
jgi:class 3 adenylate cyclase